MQKRIRLSRKRFEYIREGSESIPKGSDTKDLRIYTEESYNMQSRIGTYKTDAGYVDGR